MADGDFASLLRSTASNLGIDPSDLGTAMSYETGGTMDPNQMGGKGGQYMGLIQFSPENQQRYGVTSGMPLDQHFSAVENYLRDRGVKPGMGLLDIYSTINAGRPGLYNASDANNGGAPGTVADKVATQMVGHRANANALLRAAGDPSTATATQPQGSGAPAPAPAVDSGAVDASGNPVQGGPGADQGAKPGFDSDKFFAALGKIQGDRKKQQDEFLPPQQINTVQPRILQAALARNSGGQS